MRTFLTRLGRFLDERSELVCGIGIALLLLVGLVYSVVLGDELRYQDERDYLQLARNLVEHGEYSLVLGQPTAGRAPGYPLLLAVFVGIGIPVAGLRMVNFLLLAAAVFLLSMIARRQRQRVAAAVIPFIVLGYPLLAYTAGTFFPQTLAGFLLCFFVYAFSRVEDGAGHLALCGVTFGLAILTVPVYVLLLPALLIWIVIRRPISLRHGSLLCLLAIAATFPWLARNYLIFEAFPLLGTNAGSVLLAGNSSDTKANSGNTIDLSYYGDQVRDLDELRQHRFFARSALTNVLRNPSWAGSLYVRKLLNWFAVEPNLKTSSEHSSIRTAILAITFPGLVALILIRLRYYRREPLNNVETLILLLYLAAAAAYALFFTKIRFRVPFDQALIFIASRTVAFAFVGIRK